MDSFVVVCHKKYYNIHNYITSKNIEIGQYNRNLKTISTKKIEQKLMVWENGSLEV